MCQRLYEKHAAFLNSITADNAAVMWQYFLSAARDALAADTDAGLLMDHSSPASAGKRVFTGTDYPTPTRSARRTPRQRALMDDVRFLVFCDFAFKMK